MHQQHPNPNPNPNPTSLHHHHYQHTKNLVLNLPPPTSNTVQAILIGSDHNNTPTTPTNHNTPTNPYIPSVRPQTSYGVMSRDVKTPNPNQPALKTTTSSPTSATNPTPKPIKSGSAPLHSPANQTHHVTSPHETPKTPQKIDPAQFYMKSPVLAAKLSNSLGGGEGNNNNNNNNNNSNNNIHNMQVSPGKRMGKIFKKKKIFFNCIFFF
jgi:hypothetical protein